MREVRRFPVIRLTNLEYLIFNMMTRVNNVLIYSKAAKRIDLTYSHHTDTKL